MAQRILRHTHRQGDHLIWEGQMLKGKYPNYSYRDPDTKAQVAVRVVRWLFEENNGDTLGSTHLSQICRIEKCVEPDHFALPERTSSVRKRTKRTSAIRHHRVELIRKLHNLGYANVEIVVGLGVTASMVSRVVRSSITNVTVVPSEAAVLNSPIN